VSIITHEMNRRFYEQAVLKNPHTLAPDALSRAPRAASFVWVNDKYVLTDGSRALEVYHVPNGHAANLLMSYVPQEKLLIITDIFNDFGEPNVTTTVISDEMEISPGNLYYHFRSKDEIVNTLFAAFEREIDGVLAAPSARGANAEDVWLFLHLLFESI